MNTKSYGLKWAVVWISVLVVPWESGVIQSGVAGENSPASSVDAPQKPGAKGNPGKAASTPLSESQQQEALEFAQKEHPELAALLPGLRKSNPTEYQRALRDLHQTRVRLAGVKSRQPERYDLEVRIWKAGSRARLLAARTTMSPEEKQSLTNELKQALADQFDARLKLKELEANQIRARLATIEQELSSMPTTKNSVIDRDTSRLLKSAEVQQKSLEKRRSVANRDKAKSPKKSKTDVTAKSKPTNETPPTTKTP